MTEYVTEIRGNRVNITCKNHATSDVCRGVSALIYALVNKLKFDAEQGRISNLSINLYEGDAEIDFEYKSKHQDSVSQVLETICIGMKAIEMGYPDELTVKIR